MLGHPLQRVKLQRWCISSCCALWHLQLKACARITLKPLVETIPCLGAVTVSLLEVPTVDLALMLINKMDIMAFPGLNMAVNLGLKMVSPVPCEVHAVADTQVHHALQGG